MKHALAKAELTPEQISRWILRARRRGFEGFGGLCGVAAVALNEAVFQNRGRLIGAANAFFLAHGRFIGHIAVKRNGTFWDADGRPKPMEQIASWAVLDPDDIDHQTEAQKLGFVWTEALASSHEIVEFNGAGAALRLFPESAARAPAFVAILRKTAPRR